MNLNTLKRRVGIASMVASIFICGTMGVSLADGVQKRIKFPRGLTSTVINNAVLREDIDGG